MKPRLIIGKAEPRLYSMMLEFNKKLKEFDIDQGLQELIRVRASQLNGCGYCINIHTKDALKNGETAQRLFGLGAWWETDFFTEQEMAVLKLTEEITLISVHGVSEAVYTKALEFLGEKKLAQVIFIIININSWNRIGVSTEMHAKKDQE